MGFDFTITIGAIIQISLLAFATIGGWYKIKQETALMKVELERVDRMVMEFRASCAGCRFVEFSTRHAEIIIQHDQRLKVIESLIPSIHGQTAQLNVVNQWLQRIESKLDRT